MTKQTNKQAKEIAALRREVDELKAKAKAEPPAPEVSWEERERRAREWANEMHQMREGRMSQAMPPSVVRDWAVLDDNLVRGIAMRDARAPTGPSSQGVIPSSQQMSNVHTGGKSSTPGWVSAIPLSNPPGTAQADRLMDAQDRRDRAELIERDARLKAMQKLAEPKS